MTMAAGLAAKELTTEERIESALVVIACALTRRRPSDLFPWSRVHG
jgi:hypothetical protein